MHRMAVGKGPEEPILAAFPNVGTAFLSLVSGNHQC